VVILVAAYLEKIKSLMRRINSFVECKNWNR